MMKISELIQKLRLDLLYHGDIHIITDSLNPNLSRRVVDGSDGNKYFLLTNNFSLPQIIVDKPIQSEQTNKEKGSQ